MDITNATTRLRRTFHYPTEDNLNDSAPDVLDEEEQEDLIQTLAEQNEAHNRQYRTLLLALPLASSVPYLLALPRRPTILIALLGLTSLASTAFLLLSLPPVETGIAALDSWAAKKPTTTTTTSTAGRDDGLGALDDSDGRRRKRQRPSAGGSSSSSGSGSSKFSLAALQRQQRSPLGRYLPYLNAGLCAVLVLYGQLLARRGGGGAQQRQFGALGLGNLAAVVYAVVVVAKLVMASVDPERELEALRYGYKGA